MLGSTLIDRGIPSGTSRRLRRRPQCLKHKWDVQTFEFNSIHFFWTN